MKPILLALTLAVLIWILSVKLINFIEARSKPDVPVVVQSAEAATASDTIPDSMIEKPTRKIRDMEIGESGTITELATYVSKEGRIWIRIELTVYKGTCGYGFVGIRRDPDGYVVILCEKLKHDNFSDSELTHLTKAVRIEVK